MQRVEYEEGDALPEVGARRGARPKVDAGSRAGQLRADLLGSYLDAMAVWCELCTSKSPEPESHLGSRGLDRITDTLGQGELKQVTAHRPRT